MSSAQATISSVTPTEPMADRQSHLWEHGEVTEDTDSVYSRLIHNAGFGSSAQVNGGEHRHTLDTASDSSESDIYCTTDDDLFDYEHPVTRGSSYKSLGEHQQLSGSECEYIECEYIDCEGASGPCGIASNSPRRRPPAWDCTKLPKADALARLEGRPTGSFVIRASGKPNVRAAISLIRPDGSQFHQHIVESGGKLWLKGGAGPGHKTFGALVLHYASPAQTGLPCPLTLTGEPIPQITPVAALSAASPPGRRRAAKSRSGASEVPTATLPPEPDNVIG